MKQLHRRCCRCRFASFFLCRMVYLSFQSSKRRIRVPPNGLSPLQQKPADPLDVLRTCPVVDACMSGSAKKDYFLKPPPLAALLRKKERCHSFLEEEDHLWHWAFGGGAQREEIYGLIFGRSRKRAAAAAPGLHFPAQRMRRRRQQQPVQVQQQQQRRQRQLLLAPSGLTRVYALLCLRLDTHRRRTAKKSPCPMLCVAQYKVQTRSERGQRHAESYRRSGQMLAGDKLNAFSGLYYRVAPRAPKKDTKSGSNLEDPESRGNNISQPWPPRGNFRARIFKSKHTQTIKEGSEFLVHFSFSLFHVDGFLTFVCCMSKQELGVRRAIHPKSS